ncbi:MAG: glycoside hydrolase family 44 protein [Acidobacteriota bacterium]
MLFVFLLCATFAARAQDQAVYTDSLQNSWDNWSWAQTNLASTASIHTGTASISVTSTDTFQAAYFHHAVFSTANFTQLSFWINGGSTGGQHVQVQATIGGVAQTAVPLTLAANSWQQITIPLSWLGINSASTMDGFWIQDTSGTLLPIYYLDDITLISGAAPTPTPTPTPPVTSVTIAVDAAANRHPISPLIYGTAFATTAQLLDLNAPLNRSGGNTTTSYNWQANAANHANDFYFESIDEGSSLPGASNDSFFQSSKNGNAQPMITVPMIDWVAKLGTNRSKLASFSIAKYGPQTGNDSQFFPDAGNGIKTNGQNVTGNDPNDANTPNNVALQQGWVQHMLSTWGTSSGNGLKYYLLDNEHSIWFSTHRDVAPTGKTMDELWGKMRDYSAMIKTQDASALVLGPEEWGWGGYLYSGYDQWFANSSNGFAHPDRVAHGNMDYMPWLLQQFKSYDTANGRRLLDYFTLHYYPQGGEFGDDVSAAMQSRRNRSTRSLWDPNYVDETWINDKIFMIPRMKSWVATYYPNTKIGITEYNWGAEGNINGATTQADVYGIFGREGLDIATRWTTPATNSPVYNAMKMFRNYDGGKNGFGDTSVTATVPDPDNVSAFAAVRTPDGALTVMVVNKVGSVQTTTINLANFSGANAAQVWQLTSANSITHLGNASVVNNSISVSLPPQSITLFILAPQVIASPSNLVGTRIANTVALTWTDNSPDEDGFAIERAAGAGTFTEIYRTAPNKTVYRATLRKGTYSYRIKSVKAGQFSAASNTAQLSW